MRAARRSSAPACAAATLPKARQTSTISWHCSSVKSRNPQKLSHPTSSLWQALSNECPQQQIYSVHNTGEVSSNDESVLPNSQLNMLSNLAQA